MALTYVYPKNLPTSAVRLYRFPIYGERSSERINLLLQAIYGDIVLISTVLDGCDDFSLDYLGGLFMSEIDSTQFSS